MDRRTPSGSAAQSLPATATLPELGVRNVEMIRKIVDLPAPLGPISPTMPAAEISKLTLSTARNGPKFLHRLRTLIDMPLPSLERERQKARDHRRDGPNDQCESDREIIMPEDFVDQLLGQIDRHVVCRIEIGRVDPAVHGPRAQVPPAARPPRFLGKHGRRAAVAADR